MKIITDYFKLTDRQAEQFAQLDALYRDWNSKINVISRKDIDNLYEHHVLHSLAIAKWIPFQPDTTILDVGTGGGFPGIPLAIMFPQCQFVLVDSIGKKIKVASEVAKALGLTNVVCKQERVEEENTIVIYSDFNEAINMQKYLEDNGFEIQSMEFVRIPNDTKELTDEQRESVQKLIDKIEEDEDVQNVFTNMAE